MMHTSILKRQATLFMLLAGLAMFTFTSCDEEEPVPELRSAKICILPDAGEILCPFDLTTFAATNRFITMSAIADNISNSNRVTFKMSFNDGGTLTEVFTDSALISALGDFNSSEDGFRLKYTFDSGDLNWNVGTWEARMEIDTEPPVAVVKSILVE